jgi:hypothetical protein
MSKDPLRELSRAGAHIATEITLSTIQTAAHREMQAAAARNDWGPFEQFLGHLLILGLGIAGRAAAHGGIDVAFGPND